MGYYLEINWMKNSKPGTDQDSALVVTMKQNIAYISESDIPHLQFTSLKERLQIVENKNPDNLKG